MKQTGNLGNLGIKISVPSKTTSATGYPIKGVARFVFIRLSCCIEEHVFHKTTDFY
jgi:hypothetical protein